jgi:hypothetical protein
VTLSSRIYRSTLRAYPADLRREFGDDMTAAFAEDLASAKCIAASLRIWWWCLIDLFRIGIPAQKENPVVMVPVIAFTACIAWMGGASLIGLWLSGYRDGPFAHKALWQIASTILEGPGTVAFVGFLVARWNNRASIYFSLR